MKFQAPRLEARLTNGDGMKIMDRSKWQDLRSASTSSGPVLLPLDQLPLGTPAGVICATAMRESEDRFEMLVFRDDPIDGPDERVNVDEYRVFEGTWPSSVDPVTLTERCSTSFNGNCQCYISERAFIAKLPHGSGHHRPALPEPVRLLIDARTT